MKQGKSPQHCLSNDILDMTLKSPATEADTSNEISATKKLLYSERNEQNEKGSL